LTFIKPQEEKKSNVQLRYPIATVDYTAVSQTVKSILRSTGVPVSHIPSAKSYYELPEWFLVELPAMLGQYLSHTPFYKFPYLQVLQLFWKLVVLELQTVYRKRGLMACLNMGLVMNIVIGSVLSTLFLELYLFSVPIRFFLGLTNGNKKDVEQITITSQNSINWAFLASDISPPQTIDVQKDIKFQNYEGFVYYLEIPRHRPFTDVLLKIATQQPDLVITDISGNSDDLQLKVSIPDIQQIHWLRQLEGCEVLFTYQLPSQVAAGINVALSVKIPFLISVLRQLLNQGFHVTNIYDFN